VSLRVRRTGGRTGAVTVDYDTSAGSAREGVDYLAAHGTLSWADGDASDRVVDVDVIDDDEREQREDFTLVLSNASGGAGWRRDRCPRASAARTVQGTRSSSTASHRSR
jgi:hypothetical protein